MAEGGVWADPDKARVVVQEVKELKRWVEPYHAVRKRLEDARALHELTEAESDEDRARLVAEVLKGRALEDEVDAIAAQLEALELQNMLQGPDDARDALLTIHPGAGGTESQDWAEMLMRMYTRWAERHGFKVEILDLLEGEEAGVKSAELQISGQYAYGLLKAKKAVVDKQKTDIAFGNQIRSYVFQPYTMVNDHRTGLKVSDVQKVMDGDLDGFIEAYLKRFGSKAA